MDHSAHNKLVSFIWSIADDCLRDVYVRGKYRDVILPMVVLRRLDALLEPTKAAVLKEYHFQKDDMGLTELEDKPLTNASGYVFYNTNKDTLKDIRAKAVNSPHILSMELEAYLNGFSANVKEIISRFNLKAQIQHMARKNVLFGVLEKFVSDDINLTPFETEDHDGNRLPALSNLGMGYVFEELIRKFNEENNEEAGEHFTPREVIELMTHLVFDPVKDQLPDTITVYDPACGSGGMLTESQNFITDDEGPIQAKGRVYLYGKEVNDETYAICKSDMMIKGNDPANIRSGSTLSRDEFSGTGFDFMLSNPPYGKSWASETQFIKDGSDVIDIRFQVTLKDYWGKAERVDAVPRSSDGQLLFLMEMVSKMKPVKETAQGVSGGSRIASVHNGSSLFTGDAGGGESNIRRYIIENDWLEAIAQLPDNLFYNTGITTYIWLLSNNKPAHRKGKVQLIDASQLFRKLRKNLGKKNCEFSPQQVKAIAEHYVKMLGEEAVQADHDASQTPVAKVFDNSDFGYHKVTIERPDRRKAQFSAERIAPLRFDKSLKEPMEWAYEQWGAAVYDKTTLADHSKELLGWCEDNEITLNRKNRTKLLDVKTWEKQRKLLQMAEKLMEGVGEGEFSDFNVFRQQVDSLFKTASKLFLEESKTRFTATDKKAILNAVSWYDASAEKVIAKQTVMKEKDLKTLLATLGCAEAQLPDFGYYPVEGGKPHEYRAYESHADSRDTESVPLKDNIHDYFLNEVRPHVADAWINLPSVKVGYEVSFNKYFYKHTPLRSMEAVAQDIVTLEKQSEGLIADILGMDVATLVGEEVAHG